MPLTAPKPVPHWVENVDGKPVIRWRAVLPFPIIFSVQLLFTWYLVGKSPPAPPGSRIPFINSLHAYELCLILGWVIVYIELQRQKILSGKSRPQIGLGATMVLMALAAVVCALLGHDYREHRRDRDTFAANQTRKQRMVEIVAGNRNPTITPVVDTSLRMTELTCHVGRETFNNDDLVELIDVATDEGRVPCPIATLWLSNTQVDESGLKQVFAKCPKLKILAYFRYPIRKGILNDDLVEQLIKGLPELEQLSWNFDEFTPAQLNRLREAYPDLKLNGETWAQSGQPKN